MPNIDPRFTAVQALKDQPGFHLNDHEVRLVPGENGMNLAVVYNLATGEPDPAFKPEPYRDLVTTAPLSTPRTTLKLVGFEPATP